MKSGLLAEVLSLLVSLSELWLLEWISCFLFTKFCSIASLLLRSSSCFIFILSFLASSSASISFWILIFCFCHLCLRFERSCCFWFLRRLKKSCSSFSFMFLIVIGFTKLFFDDLTLLKFNKSTDLFVFGISKYTLILLNQCVT